MFIQSPGNYGDLELTGINPALRQADNPLRIRSPGLVKLGYVKARDCGMPIRHEYCPTSRLSIHTLDCKRFTADLFNSFGEIEIENVIIDFDGTDFTEEDYKLLHPDVLGQVFNHQTQIVQNVHIHNIYARIRGKLIKGFASTEDHLCRNVKIGTGIVDIEIEYEFAALFNTLENGFVNVGNNGVRILDVKESKHKSKEVEIVNHEGQTITADFNPILLNTRKVNKMKVAFIVGHNERSQGAVRMGVTEYAFWQSFFVEHWSELESVAAMNNIEIKLFHRKYHGRRKYGTEMRELHKRVDNWGASISMECHYNGSANKVNGHEVLHYKGSQGGKILANIIDKAMDKHLENNDRGRKPVGIGENGNLGLRVGAARAALLEPFFGQEIKEFLSEGSQRENLVNTFKDILKGIVEIRVPGRERMVPVSVISNNQLTVAEFQAAMDLLI